MKKLIRVQFCIAIFLALIVPFSVFAQTSGDVKIGKQIWMSKNLDVSTYRNGEQIPQAKDAAQWKYAVLNKIPAWCYYEFNESNGKKYGKFYNWYAVSDSRGLAPNGYHIPSDAEWTILTDFLGGSDIAGKKMKSTNGWANRDNGDNSSGFNGLPGGYCYYSGSFNDITAYGYFWSSSEKEANSAWSRGLYYSSTKVFRSNDYKSDGLSVRCLRD